jgi:hypothetical protein
MRQTTTILFLLLFCNVYGQKWHLNRIDKISKFKYEYWFQFENADDSSSYNFKKTDGKSLSTIQLTDNKGDMVVFATIKIKDLENDTSFIIVTDFDGLGKIQLKPSKYNMEITALNYDKFIFDFSVFENENFNLKVKLGLGPESDVYQINSKVELKEKEILTIINCVKENRQDYYKKCLDQKRYYVMMHI